MTLEDRFMSKILVDEKTNCWNWNASMRDGYGRFKADKKMMNASRFSFEYFNEKILNGNVIMHLCDNPKCVNPKHLKQGSHKENAQDKVLKNRHIFGEKAWQHKLTEKEIIEIKEKLKNPYCGINNDLAHFYKVNHRTISSIRRGITWAHISIT